MTQSADKPPVRAHILVSGRVQGVGFRAFAARTATRFDLVGGVRNRNDGRVELEVEGGKTVIEALLQELNVGPPTAQVRAIEVEWSLATNQYSHFTVWY